MKWSFHHYYFIHLFIYFKSKTKMTKWNEQGSNIERMSYFIRTKVNHYKLHESWISKGRSRDLVFTLGWLISEPPSKTSLSKYHSRIMNNYYIKHHVFRGFGAKYSRFQYFQKVNKHMILKEIYLDLELSGLMKSSRILACNLSDTWWSELWKFLILSGLATEVRASRRECHRRQGELWQ